MRRGALRRLVADLGGGLERELVDRLHGQVEAAQRGVVLARSAAVGHADTVELSARMDAAEREGDDERAALVATLSAALMTPFDREDLFRVSRSIDDVLDNLRDFVRELALLGVRDPGFVPILDAVDACLADLDTAVMRLVTDRPGLVGAALDASKTSNQVRKRYQEQLAALLDSPEVTPEVLKRRELLRRLDVVGLRLGEATDALADGAVKRG